MYAAIENNEIILTGSFDEVSIFAIMNGCGYEKLSNNTNEDLIGLSIIDGPTRYEFENAEWLTAYSPDFMPTDEEISVRF